MEMVAVPSMESMPFMVGEVEKDFIPLPERERFSYKVGKPAWRPARE
jgi:hypothetical protein